MNKKLSLVALGIALAGVLVYVLLSSTQLKESPAVPDKSASSVSGSPSVSAEQPLLEARPSPRETVNSTSDDPVASAVVPPEQQQAPALEPEIRESLSEILNTSSEGLVEEQTDNGAVRLNLQGRFRTAPVATVDAEGNVQIKDYSSLPPVDTQQ